MTDRTVSLSAYIVQVHELYSRTAEPLDGFGAAANGKFSTFLRKLANDLMSKPHTSPQGCLRCDKVLQDHDYRMGFSIHGGEYGYEALLFDVEGKRASKKRELSDAETIPFYVGYRHAPAGTRGVLIHQRFGQGGVATLFNEILASRFASSHEQFRTKLDRVAPKKVLEKVAKENSKSIRHRMIRPWKDKADRLPGVWIADGEYDVEVIVRPAKRGERLKWKRENALLTEEERNPTIRITVPGPTGRDRSYVVTNSEILTRTELEITPDMVALDTRTGHPDIEALHVEAMKYAEEFL